jgi:hypothetical protein
MNLEYAVKRLFYRGLQKMVWCLFPSVPHIETDLGTCGTVEDHAIGQSMRKVDSVDPMCLAAADFLFEHLIDPHDAVQLCVCVLLK